MNHKVAGLCIIRQRRRASLLKLVSWADPKEKENETFAQSDNFVGGFGRYAGVCCSSESSHFFGADSLVPKVLQQVVATFT